MHLQTDDEIDKLSDEEISTFLLHYHYQYQTTHNNH